LITYNFTSLNQPKTDLFDLCHFLTLVRNKYLVQRFMIIKFAFSSH